MAPHAANITLSETLALLDGQLSAVAAGISRDEFAFWLGSGISLGRLDGLRALIPRVLEHLRQRLNPGDANCRFRMAFEEILDLAAVGRPERVAIDFSAPVAGWAGIDGIIERLSGNYSRFLEIVPRGEEQDYLLWEAVDVTATYADPTTEPDSEHLCLAALILEGVASVMPSANWDGLIERAIQAIAPGSDALVVCVLPEDLRLPAHQATLYKFHGCAVRAREEEDTYRPRLVARLAQINNWINDVTMTSVVNRLIDIATSKRTLMIGLSAQDGNIQTIFSAAHARMPWDWPVAPPAYVFSEERLGIDQRSLLQNVYRTGYSATTRDAIYDAALIRAYAKPLLSALVLHILAAKLCALLKQIASLPEAPDLASLCSGIIGFRDYIAAAIEPPAADRVLTAIEMFAHCMAIYHDGDTSSTKQPYRPITPRPTQSLAGDPLVRSAGLRELSVALALIGLCVQQSIWGLEPSDPADASSGAFKIAGMSTKTKVFIVANTTSATHLRASGSLNDPDDAIVIYGLHISPSQARSPRPSRLRTGAPGTREVSIASLLDEVATADDLMQRFREEVAI